MQNNFKKIINDPVHGEVVFDSKNQWAYQIINTIEFQRMRKISQLGTVSLVFPGATHTRINHSIGTFHIANRFINHLKKSFEITENDIKEVLCAALLHDIGHGPLSHSFERFVNQNHEEYSIKIIKSPRTKINEIISKNNINIDAVCSLIEGTHKGSHWKQQLISSQLDCDRLDYLMRDSYYSGIVLGKIDLSFIISSSKILDDKLAFESKAISSIENYLVSRYHMYFQIYENRSAIGFEMLIENIFKRVKDLKKQGYKFTKSNRFKESFKSFLNNNPLTTEEYLKLNDYELDGFITDFSYEKDEILSKLAKLFISRKNYKNVPFSRTSKNNISKEYPTKWKKYAISRRDIKIRMYHFSKQPIIISKDDKVYNFQDKSNLLNLLRKSDNKETFLFFMPKELLL
jgi:HD superfamily phosphohydrolase